MSPMPIVVVWQKMATQKSVIYQRKSLFEASFFTYGGVVVVFVVDAFDRNLPSVKTPNRLWSFYPERVE